MTAFWIALLLVFIAEMGDKTQLVALAFATRFSAGTVLAGVSLATLLVHLFSVAIGEAAGMALPTFWINLSAGISFFIFGLWTLRGDESGNEKERKESGPGPFMTVATSFFLAELGDKTMLMTISIASQQKSFMGVWVGSTLGMVVADGIAIVVGKVLGKRLPEKIIKYGAALIFIAAGAYFLIEALRRKT